MMKPITQNLSFMQRQAIARQSAADRHADRTDEGNILRRRLRAELMSLNDVEGIADRQFAADNDPVRAPKGVGSGNVHPQRAAALAQFVVDQGWPEDPLSPIVPTPTRAETIAHMAADARARYAAAHAAYEAHEAGEPIEAPVPIETVEPVEQPRRGPGRPRKAAFVDISGIESD